MDDTAELIATLRQGHKVNLMLAPQEPVANAHALIKRLEAQGLSIESRPYTVDGRVGFVIWSVEHQQPRVVGY